MNSIAGWSMFALGSALAVILFSVLATAQTCADKGDYVWIQRDQACLPHNAIVPAK